MNFPELSDIYIGREIYTRNGDKIDPKPIHIHKGNISQILNELDNEIKASSHNRKYILKPIDNNDIIKAGWELSGEDEFYQRFIKSKEFMLFFDPEDGWIDIYYKGMKTISINPRDIYDLIYIEKMLNIY